LPEPFGPTITFTPGSNSRMVGSANDLNPASFKALTYIRATLAAAAGPLVDIDLRRRPIA
jgi:hypothetical protein